MNITFSLFFANVTAVNLVKSFILSLYFVFL